MIQQAVWLYARFTLSFRDVEDLLAERGIMVFYLWRAVDAEGEVLDVLVQSKRDKRAALKLMRK
ncbi:MAG: DDE-type integrase/transposase/recombinase, partial [Rhodoplanes sp.]